MSIAPLIYKALYGCPLCLLVGRVKSKDKSDRATTEQAMDPRTRRMLFKMINRQLFAEVNGCISTGKEANVYHACRADGMERAIKVCIYIYIHTHTRLMALCPGLPG